MLDRHPALPRDVQHREPALEERQSLHRRETLIRGGVRSKRARRRRPPPAAEHDAVAEDDRGVPHPRRRRRAFDVKLPPRRIRRVQI
eukprot:6867-Pelagococcus_subviridis.AAC.2